MPTRTPTELARETVKQLTARRLAPTPENFQSIYHEIAGTRPLQPFPMEQLRRLVQALPRQSPGQQRLGVQLDKAVSQNSWEGLHNALVSYVDLGPAKNVVASAPSSPPASFRSSALMSDDTSLDEAIWREPMARIIDHALPAVGSDDARLLEQAQELVQYLRLPRQEPAALRMMLSNFAHRLSFAAEEQGAIRSTLLELLGLVFENIGGLALDDAWLKGQMDNLRDAAKPPLSVRRLESLRSQLRDVIHKQTEAREQTLAAQASMKQTLTTFVDRLARMSDESSQYSNQMGRCAQQLEGAKSLSDIAPVLQEAISASRLMATDSLRAQEELRTMRQRSEYEAEEIRRLQQELDRVSTLARHDALTGALNRKGLDEASARELGRARRLQSATCVALLDLDDFKRLNDTHGHGLGDAALVHVSTVTREVLRPQDSLARYGGEEFVVVMPDTTLEQGVEAMTRVQRELTKRIFLEGNQRVLITFSAGVAQLLPDEDANSAIQRADQGMYLAKRAGKNRVVGV